MASSAAAIAFSPTVLAYLDDTSRLEGEATVLGVVPAAEGAPLDEVILDATLFYPEGGGQPSDVGEIRSEAQPGKVFRVTHVKADKSGVVRHSGEGHTFQAGDKVVLSIDGPTRARHARLHSAGHLLDSCLAAVGGEYAGMEATKGWHGEDAYVEYRGKVPEADREALVAALNEEAASRVAADGEVTVSVDSYEDAAAKVPGGKLPPYIPAGSTPRMVTLAGLACPCGGTHVADVADVGGMTVTGIRVKKGITRLSYRVN